MRLARLAGSERIFGAHPFSRLAHTHALSTAGDALIAVSLAGSLFFSVSLDAARPRLALYLVLTLAPFAIVAPFIGPLVDRFGRRQPAFVAFTGQGRAILALFIAMDLRNLLLYPESFAVLVLGKAYSVTKSSLVPRLVTDDTQLVTANARLSRVGAVAAATAGAIGVGIAAAADETWVLRLAAVVHLGASALALRIPRRRAREQPATTEAEGELAGRNIRLAAFAMGTLRAAVGLVTFGLAFVLRRAGAPAIFFGVVALAAAAGNFAATIVSGAIRRHWLREEAMLVGALGVAAAAAIAATIWSGRPGQVGLAAGVALAAGVGRQAFDSLLQRDAPGAARGRAFARYEAVFQLVWVVGAIIPVVVELREPGAFAGLGVFLSGAALAYLVWSNRTRPARPTGTGRFDQPSS